MPDSALLRAIVIAWLVSGLIAALIANERERSALAFFFVTLFFLGPFGPGFALIATHGGLEELQIAELKERRSALGRA